MKSNFAQRVVGPLVLVALLVAVRPICANTRASGEPGTPDQFHSAKVCNVADYHASGNGKVKDTTAIRDAIAACQRDGGGVVYFPPGAYLTGQIILQNNITIYLEAGATLLGSHDPDDFPLRPSPYHDIVGKPWPDITLFYSALLYADGASNIGVEGSGTIDGQGRWWWDKVTLILQSWKGVALTEAQQRDVDGVLHHMRPPLINFVNCHKVRIEGVTLQNAAAVNIEPTFCDDVVVRGVTIVAPVAPLHAYNTDGIDPCSCRHVRITDCVIDVGDDCIAIKSGKDKWGRQMGRASEDIAISNCVMLHGHGGVAIGSEMSGGVKNVVVSNCSFHGTATGLRMKTVRGRGGVVDGFAASNITMDDVPTPIVISMYYGTPGAAITLEPVNEDTPTFRNVMFSNILARGARVAGTIVGIPEMPPSDLVFSHIHIAAEKGLQCHWARGVSLHDVQIDTAQGPALSIGDTEQVEIEGFHTTSAHPATPVMDLENIRNAYLRGNWALPGSDVYVKFSGKATRGIVLMDNNLGAAAQPVMISPEVETGAVIEK